MSLRPPLALCLLVLAPGCMSPSQNAPSNEVPIALHSDDLLLKLHFEKTEIRDGEPVEMRVSLGNLGDNDTRVPEISRGCGQTLIVFLVNESRQPVEFAYPHGILHCPIAEVSSVVDLPAHSYIHYKQTIYRFRDLPEGDYVLFATYNATLSRFATTSHWVGELQSQNVTVRVRPAELRLVATYSDLEIGSGEPLFINVSLQNVGNYSIFVEPPWWASDGNLGLGGEMGDWSPLSRYPHYSFSIPWGADPPYSRPAPARIEPLIELRPGETVGESFVVDNLSDQPTGVYRMHVQYSPRRSEVAVPFWQSRLLTPEQEVSIKHTRLELRIALPDDAIGPGEDLEVRATLANVGNFSVAVLPLLFFRSDATLAFFFEHPDGSYVPADWRNGDYYPRRSLGNNDLVELRPGVRLEVVATFSSPSPLPSGDYLAQATYLPNLYNDVTQDYWRDQLLSNEAPFSLREGA